MYVKKTSRMSPPYGLKWLIRLLFLIKLTLLPERFCCLTD